MNAREMTAYLKTLCQHLEETAVPLSAAALLSFLAGCFGSEGWDLYAGPPCDCLESDGSTDCTLSWDCGGKPLYSEPPCFDEKGQPDCNRSDCEDFSDWRAACEADVLYQDPPRDARTEDRDAESLDALYEAPSCFDDSGLEDCDATSF